MKKKSKEKEMAFLHLEELKLGLDGRAYVSLNQEKKVYEIIPTHPNFLVLIGAVTMGDPQAIEVWESLVEAFLATSLSMKDNLPDYYIAVFNPYNTKNWLLLILNGVILYDFASKGQTQ